MNARSLRAHGAAVLLSTAIAGCGAGAAATQARHGDPGPDPTILNQTCEDAFVAWVATAQRLNEPDADLGELLFKSETQQRTVFELCTLEEAERLNVEHPLEPIPGVKQPMIEPDFRTFADVECVDESPLLDGTPLCAEVGH